MRKPVDRFTPDKAHGYFGIKKHMSTLVTCLSFHSIANDMHQVNCAVALAMDPNFGILDGLSSLPPDFLTRHPNMFKSKKGSDPDTPTMKEALTGPCHDEFLEAMSQEIDELEAHQTWTVVEKSSVASSSKIIPSIEPVGSSKTNFVTFLSLVLSVTKPQI